MLGHIEKYHHGRYADVGRLWLIAPDDDGTFSLPVICPNCESTYIDTGETASNCATCGLGMIPDR